MSKKVYQEGSTIITTEVKGNTFKFSVTTDPELRKKELHKAHEDMLAQYMTPEGQKAYWALEEAKKIYEENHGKDKTFNR